MTEDRLSRLVPLSGVLFVVLELAGVAIAGAGGHDMVTLSDPSSKIVNAFADPVGSGFWVGAYLELASMVAFAVFAAWLFRSGRGPLATAGLISAGVDVALTAIALVVGDVLEYRAGHGLGTQETLALFDVQSALYICTWGLGAVVLALAPLSGWLRRSALAVAALSLLAMAFPTADVSQMSAMLFLGWIGVASVAMSRRPRTIAGTTPAPA